MNTHTTPQPERRPERKQAVRALRISLFSIAATLGLSFVTGFTGTPYTAAADPADLAQQAAPSQLEPSSQPVNTPYQANEDSVEEVVVTARAYSSAQALINERLDDEVVSDILGAESISRLGDSTVAAALRRISGLSLVGGKFVYVRGLGERYSSTTLDGASIPSPDLTRNVIPLDIFPTSVVKSLKVQKSYSPDMSANFGGGNVDIRTSGIPEAFTYSFEIGGGYNLENDGTVVTYPGGSDDNFGTDDGTRELPAEVTRQIQRFRGNVDVQSVLTELRAEGDATATLADAQRVNRELGLSLNRNIGLKEKDDSPDLDLKGSIGNNFLLTDQWEIGFIAGASYGSEWREKTRKSRNFVFPEQRTDTRQESTHSINLTGNLNLGLRFAEDHEINATSLYLRNTDDETEIRDFFNENREKADGIGFRDYRLQFEERSLTSNQIKGSHHIGPATKEAIPGHLLDWVPEELEVNWFYSDSEAHTDIPNQVNVDAQTVTDPVTGQVLSSAVALDATAADYRFTDLDDEVRNYGWNAVMPFQTDTSSIEMSLGYAHDQKARTYAQSQFSLGALNVADPSVLSGPLNEVFSDQHILDPNNNFVFDLQGTKNQSYLAATMTEAVYGKIDWTWNDTLRLAAGARWEDYKQVALDWNLYGFTLDEPQISNDPAVLARGVFEKDDYYPAVALTYMGSWLAETFQLRFGWSQTAVRPDLREITSASYVDPITEDLVSGNPGVVPADVTNYDLRGEWVFGNGDNLTLSAFYKKIDNPIELFESAASDTTIAREIVNAESADVYGIELEGLKSLGFLGDRFEPFFIQGNLTLQDSELVAGANADAPTNLKRKLAGASDYVANVMLGYDSSNGKHTASLIYNVFGERLFVAGRLGAPDGFEQPFQSLDFTYFWYPTDLITVKLKLQNILNDTITIKRENVTVFEQDPGQQFALSVKIAL